MTRSEVRPSVGWKEPPPQHTPRLRLKPKGTPTGRVDGAWWPHSDDLEAEVPDLLAVLSVRLGPISYVLYKMTEWVKAGRTMPIGGRFVRLGGYQRQPSNTIEIRGLGGRKVVLLVVPAATDPDRAHAIMMAASAPENASSVDDLLPAVATTPRLAPAVHRSVDSAVHHQVPLARGYPRHLPMVTIATWNHSR